MIKIGDKVKIVSLHKRDAFFKDGIPGSIGIVKSLDQTCNKNGINYYAGNILITRSSETSLYKDQCDTIFFFAYAQLRKVRK